MFLITSHSLHQCIFLSVLLVSVIITVASFNSSVSNFFVDFIFHSSSFAETTSPKSITKRAKKVMAALPPDFVSPANKQQKKVSIQSNSSINTSMQSTSSINTSIQSTSSINASAYSTDKSGNSDVEMRVDTGVYDKDELSV